MVYPELQDKVAIVSVAFDETESTAGLVAFNTGNGYTWPTVRSAAQVARAYNIIIRSSLIGVARDGTIVLRKGYGGAETAEDWRTFAQQLLNRG